MYKLVPLICGVLILCIGIFMIVKPDKAVKAKYREDEAMVNKIKNNGIMMCGAGVILIILYFV
ncbi:MAG: hypothetical protein ACI4SE_02685 [Lachnospiraceae bacterium]